MSHMCFHNFGNEVGLYWSKKLLGVSGSDADPASFLR